MANARDFRFCTRVGHVMSECSLSGRGQGHMSNLYIVDLANFATASCRYTGGIHYSTSSVCLWHLRQWQPTRSRHGWVHIVYHALPPTKPPTSCDQFGQDLSYKGSFCTVVWQLARLLLTRCIARSLGDSWASCCIGVLQAQKTAHGSGILGGVLIISLQLKRHNCEQ